MYICVANIDWDIFTAIFQAIGAIGTLLAVIVALWQTKYTNRKRLKLSFTEVGSIVFANSKSMALVTLTISNIGNRAVTIQNWGFVLTKKRQAMVLQDPNNTILKAVNTLLPRKIDPEETINLVITADDFIQNIENYVQKGIYNDNQKIKVFCTDSVGNIYKTRTRSTIRQMKEYIRNSKS